MQSGIESRERKQGTLKTKKDYLSEDRKLEANNGKRYNRGKAAVKLYR